MKFLFKNHRGQATVEYFLLIVVVISLGLGVSGPLGRALSRFSSALIGVDGYYSCLIKKGLLPPANCDNKVQISITGLSALSKNSTGLAGKSYSGLGSSKNNTLSNATNSSSNTTGASSGTSSNKNNKYSKARSKSKNTSKNRAANSNFAVNSSASEPGSSSAQQAFQKRSIRFKQKRKRKKRGKGSGQKDSSSLTDGSSKKLKGFSKIKNTTQQNVTYNSSTGEGYLGTEIVFIQPPREEVFKVEKQAGSAKKASNKAAEKSKTSKIQAIKDKKKIKNLDEGFNFQKWIKYFFLVTIIMIILAVIFSQIMEFQKE